MTSKKKKRLIEESVESAIKPTNQTDCMLFSNVDFKTNCADAIDAQYNMYKLPKEK